mmetsp:Transcript_3477/g.12659  ORF Transcript_3477/g.12659 Transcript_3477/m.12659 type:complete len:1172 (-) Transcript_3477:89-3604(-)
MARSSAVAPTAEGALSPGDAAAGPRGGDGGDGPASVASPLGGRRLLAPLQSAASDAATPGKKRKKKKQKSSRKIGAAHGTQGRHASVDASGRLLLHESSAASMVAPPADGSDGDADQKLAPGEVPSVKNMHDVKAMTPNRRGRLMRSLTSAAASPTTPGGTAAGNLLITSAAKSRQGPMVGDAVDWMLDPTDLEKQVWEATYLGSLLWIVLRAPYFVAFEHPMGVEMDTFSEVVDDLVTAILILDILATFRTVLEDDGDLVVDPKKIAKAYLTGHFVFDCLVSFPWYAVASSYPGLRLIRLLRCFPTRRLNSAEKIVMEWLSVGDRWYHSMVLFKLLMAIYIVAHCAACMWHYIATVENIEDSSWIYFYHMGENGATLGARYSSALYWAFATLATVGYGDVSAHTNLERLFAMFLIIMGAGLFGLIVGKMSKLSESMGMKIQEYKRRQTAANQFLKNRRVPKKLRKRTFEYYEYVLRHAAFMDERTIMEDLSPSLRRELTFLLHKDILEEVPVLSFGSHGFQAVVVEMLEPTLVLEGEYVLITGDAAQEMYFIKDGIMAFVDNHGLTFRELEAGSFFGEVQVLDGTRCDTSVRAKTNCELLGLSRTNLAALLQDFPEFENTLRAAAAMRASHGGGKKLASSALLVSKLTKKAAKARSNIGTSVREIDEDGGDEDSDSEAAARIAEEARPRCNTPPLELKNWGELMHQMKDMEKVYRTAVGNSRTLQAERFDPQPVEASSIRPPSHLEGVVKRLAEHTHAVWATQMLTQGWKWGRQKNEAAKTSPELVPWKDAPESTKSLNMVSAAFKVQTVMALGYVVLPVDATVDTDGSGSEDDTGSLGAGASYHSAAAAAAAGASTLSRERERDDVVAGLAGDGSVSRSGAGAGGSSVAGSEAGSHASRIRRPRARRRSHASRHGDYMGSPTAVAPTVKTTYLRNVGGRQVEATFVPKPLKLHINETESDPVCEALVRALAMQEHLSWARAKKDAGWTWGTHDSESDKKTHDLVPWSLLEATKKDLLIADARRVVAALLALDCTITARGRADSRGLDADGADESDSKRAFSRGDSMSPAAMASDGDHDGGAGAAAGMFSSIAAMGMAGGGGTGGVTSPGSASGRGPYGAPSPATSVVQQASPEVMARLDRLDANVAKIMTAVDALRRSVQSLPSGGGRG